jgi:ABC-type branched-subunit amino acid transport system ATPase component
MKTIEKSAMEQNIGQSESSTILEFRDLVLSYGAQKVLNGASGKLCQGDFITVIGSNGSGKTSLLNIMAGYLEPNAGSITLYDNAGKVKKFNFPQSFWQRLNIFSGFAPEIVADMGIVKTWQGGRSFGTLSLLDNILVVIKDQFGENPLWSVFRPDLVRKQEMKLRRRVVTALTDLGLGDRVNSSADMVSLGQGMRVMILRASMTGAMVLLLDEPLAGLDAEGKVAVMTLLQELKEQGVTIVIVEHVFNLPHVLSLATAVWKLEQGKLLVEDAAMVKADLEASLGNSDRAWLESLAGDRGNIQDIPLEGGAVLSIVTRDAVELGQPILEVQDFGVMRGRRQILCNISFTLYAGQIAVLFAANGYGKTSLLDSIAGLIPCSGRLLLHGKPIHRLPAWEREKRGLRLLRARDNIFPNLKVSEMLRLSGVSDPPENVKPFLEKQVSALSGGERQRVVLACTLASSDRRSAVLQMMDEPFGALDAIGVREMRELIEFDDSKVYLIALPANI